MHRSLRCQGKEWMRGDEGLTWALDLSVSERECLSRENKLEHYPQ